VSAPTSAAWARVAALCERAEIEELLRRYCRAIDGKDFALLDDVFTPEAVIDYTASGGIRGPLVEIRRWLAEALAPFVVIQHLITNVDLELDAGRGRGRTYFFNPMGLDAPDGGRTMFFCGGVYHDEFVRTADGWRIASRINEQKYMYGSLPEGFRIPD
jgi:hypothetical protein